MSEATLSLEQERVLDANVRVVEAGPGAGKTRALVARYLRSAQAASRGVALLSFTNAAVEEVRARAGGRADLLQAPHFVGTIDAFLHRFIVTPSVVSVLNKLPSYLRSWDDLPPDSRSVRVWGIPGVGIRLSLFHVDQAGEVGVDLGDLRWDEGAYWKKVDGEGAVPTLLDVARGKIIGFRNAGVFDAASARVRAFSIVNGVNEAAVIDRIALRFEEILVDEAQDCDEPEFSIIELLSSRVRTVVVADPDQAIYEFRGSIPKLFLEYRDAQAPEDRCALSTNYRSSAAICSTVRALRAAGDLSGDPPDDAQGPPTYVLVGTEAQQREKFRALLGDHEIQTHDAIVLAHKWRTAYSAAGRTPPDPQSQAGGNVLAMAIGTLRKSAATPSERLQAVRKVEALIMGAVEWPEELRTAGRHEQLGALDRTSDWLRVEAGRVIALLGDVGDAAAFGAMARAAFEAALQPLSLPHASLSQRLKKPTAEVWSRCFDSSDDDEVLQCSSIHGAKGHEYEAVLVALPSTLPKKEGRNVLDDWEGGHNTEPRRVLYVACSRARRLLAFGAGPHADRIHNLLEAAGVTAETS